MTDIATIARANAISVEAKLVRHSKRADGGINIGLAIHPHGIPQALIDAQLGDRFMVALVQIDEHEQPIPVAGAAAPAAGRSMANEQRATQYNPGGLDELTNHNAQHVGTERGSDEPAPSLSHNSSGPDIPARARKSSPPQRCAILCNDPSFWIFLNKTYHQTMPAGCGVQDAEGAAALVRFLCNVKSRSEIIPGTPAFDKWDAILSNYVGWSVADKYVEAS